ncbi:hypothetical protein GCM10010211_58550 [Streptomyces albospinus]|uniref:Uncharacterized protein n=1 Tax=Streptomyces albospinus TaxID=285515 RepID=A0ABQ2VG34_9ACTN|nr:hypothetical protein GCM10010211_58550 [Streptomyces albospinus]
MGRCLRAHIGDSFDRALVPVEEVGAVEVIGSVGPRRVLEEREVVVTVDAVSSKPAMSVVTWLRSATSAEFVISLLPAV